MTTAFVAPVRPGPYRAAAGTGPPCAPTSLDSAELIDAYGAHRGAAYQLAYRILNDGPAAEDAVQDAFLKLWTGSSQFDPGRGTMRGLLLTITRHTSIDLIRRRASRQRTEHTYCTDETWISDGPEQATERGEDARNVQSALVSLPSGQRSVIEMAYFSGLTRQQIAAEMTIPIGTVKSRMRLGMRKLAETLGEGAAV